MFCRGRTGYTHGGMEVSEAQELVTTAQLTARAGDVCGDGLEWSASLPAKERSTPKQGHNAWRGGMGGARPDGPAPESSAR
jgi:hypothetical protein